MNHCKHCNQDLADRPCVTDGEVATCPVGRGLFRSTPDSAAAPAAIPALIEAAEAVIARWYSPKWKDEKPTSEFIQRLRVALDAAHQPPASDGDVPMPDCGDVLKFGSEIVQLATRFANNEIHSYQLASAVEKKLRAYGDARALAALASAGKPSGLDAIDAARYRWLRQHDIPDDAQDWISAGKFDDFGVDGLHGKELDDAIDAAMKGETA